MAGTLIINPSADWLPAGWLFDEVLESIASEVASTQLDLARSLRAARTDAGSGYIDMTGWSAARMAAVVDAATSHLSHTESAGSQAFHDPEFFPGYLAQVDDLISKLRRDPRVTADGG